MRHFRPSILLRLLYRKAVFRVPVSSRTVYLSFDDGPTPGQTESIIKILQQFNVPATFFLCGRNLTADASLIDIIRDSGFSTANHGMNHINGLYSGCKEYIQDAMEGEKFSDYRLFRPPYGAIRPCQYNKLKKRYRIIFWDIMPYDFDSTLDSKIILKKVKELLRPGSIIVLHDNPDSGVLGVLQDIIKLCTAEGYSFGDLSDDLIKAD